MHSLRRLERVIIRPISKKKIETRSGQAKVTVGSYSGLGMWGMIQQDVLRITLPRPCMIFMSFVSSISLFFLSDLVDHGSWDFVVRPLDIEHVYYYEMALNL